jgi:hypothetical protein
MSLEGPSQVLLKDNLPLDLWRRSIFPYPLALEKTIDFPLQQSPLVHPYLFFSRGNLDMRNWLTPRRLTILLWDKASLMAHAPDEAYADYDRVPGDALERGYW